MVCWNDQAQFESIPLSFCRPRFVGGDHKVGRPGEKVVACVSQTAGGERPAQTPRRGSAIYRDSSIEAS